MKVSTGIRLSSISGFRGRKPSGQGGGVAVLLLLQMILGATPAGGREYSVRIDAKSAVLLGAFSVWDISTSSGKRSEQFMGEGEAR